MNINTATLNHPKVIKLKRRLGSDAVLSLFTLWAWAEQERPDGILSDLDEEDIAIAADWDGDDRFFVTALIELRLLDWDGKTLVLSHWPGSRTGQPTQEPQDQARIEQARNAARARWEKGKSVTPMLSDAQHESACAQHHAQHDAVLRTVVGSCSNTTTTQNPSSSTSGEGENPGCNAEESELVYPPGLSGYQRQQAETLVQSQGPLAQPLLDELAAAIKAGKIRSSPIAYLRALVNRAQEGRFQPDTGHRIAQDRERRAQAEAAVAAAEARPPTSSLPPTRPERPPRSPEGMRRIAGHLADLKAALAGRQPTPEPTAPTDQPEQETA
ncbi:MAG: hypothetical protein RKO66_11975 [Candidatus Contendobacter sp.]|nr:hypothetical protein [Candidatus Contendobacter sp.]MDS4059657.1 hypothetical protein [Candidatus Contendobacter sp.]